MSADGPWTGHVDPTWYLCRPVEKRAQATAGARHGRGAAGGSTLPLGCFLCPRPKFSFVKRVAVESLATVIPKPAGQW